MAESILPLLFLVFVYFFASIQFFIFFQPLTPHWLESRIRPTRAIKFLHHMASIPPISDQDTDYLLDLNFSSTLQAYYDEDVVVLTADNFNAFVHNHRYVMVVFYAPWCPYCINLAPEYAAAATALKEEAMLAKVDATAETNLAATYKVSGYPSLYFFVDGVHMRVDNLERNRDAIAKWIRTKIAGANPIMDIDEAKRVSSIKSMMVLGIYDSNLEGPENEELVAASKLQTDIKFFKTSSSQVLEVLRVDPKIRRPAVVIVDKETKSYIRFDGPFTRLAIAKFVSKNKHPLVTNFTYRNAELVMDDPNKQLWLFTPMNDSETVISSFREVAKYFRGKLRFVHLRSNYLPIAKDLNLTIIEDAPTVATYSIENNPKFTLNTNLNASSIKVFAQRFIELEATQTVEHDLISSS